jgi:hypothetical protein
MPEKVESVELFIHGPVFLRDVRNKSLMKRFLKIVREGRVDTIGNIW